MYNLVFAGFEESTQKKKKTQEQLQQKQFEKEESETLPQLSSENGSSPVCLALGKLGNFQVLALWTFPCASAVLKDG